jgi:hypothetical protein
MIGTLLLLALFTLRWGLTNFLPGLTSNNSPYLSPQVVRMIGVSHQHPVNITLFKKFLLMPFLLTFNSSFSALASP